MITARRAAPLAALAMAALAVSTAGAATITVTESAPDVRLGTGVVSPTAKGALVFFGGMRSPEGNPRGHVMGYEDLPLGTFSPVANSVAAFAFGSGARIVAQRVGTSRVRAGFARPLVGGTGPYLGAQGTERTTRANGRYTHIITYTLPPKGTKRTTFTVNVKYGTPVIVPRGGTGGVGNGRNLTASLTNAAGQPDGTYAVDSVLEHVYSGGAYEWYVGDGTFTFADGSTLHAVGPFQRATGTAPGVLAASPRPVNNGTGRFAGMRGQVVLTPSPAGGTDAAFTLVRWG